jgi:3-oxoacyl-[acyl-carrier-protein] synthase II
MNRRVVVTGMGVVSPLGNDCRSFFKKLADGESGIRRISRPLQRSLGTSIAGEVDINPLMFFPRPKLALLDRFSQFALRAAEQAAAEADLQAADPQERGGVYLGTGMGGAQTLEAAYEDLLSGGKDRLPPYTILRAMNNAAAAHISIDFSLRGPSVTYSSACSSSALAIGEAFRAIRHGYIDVAIAGGSESLLTAGATRAWEALRTLAQDDEEDPAASCRPFSRDRTGLVLAEGGGMLVLEELEHARRRGVPCLAELIGYGSSSDAAQLARPSLEGQARAMEIALEDAGIEPNRVDYINAHGTGTVAGDMMETLSIHRVFGAAALSIPVSSTKSMHGHMMGAAGAVEFIACIMALREQVIPPTANLRVKDPECDLDYVPGVGRRASLEIAMSNSFAFGGSNAVLVSRRIAPM